MRASWQTWQAARTWCEELRARKGVDPGGLPSQANLLYAGSGRRSDPRWARLGLAGPCADCAGDVCTMNCGPAAR